MNEEEIKKLSAYDLADEFNTQTFIVNDDKKFIEILLIDHFKNVNEIEKLQQALNEIEKYIENHKRKSETRIYGLEIPEFIFNGDVEDIEVIIQKAKGDVNNEN